MTSVVRALPCPHLSCPVERSEGRVKEVFLDPRPAGGTGPELYGVGGDLEVDHARGETHGEGDGEDDDWEGIASR